MLGFLRRLWSPAEVPPPAEVPGGEEAFWVIGPKADTPPEQLRAVGAALHSWLERRTYAKRAFGMDDLTDGRFPTSPPYFALRYPESCPERWPLALLTVTPGTVFQTAQAELADDLAACRHLLAWFTDPYSHDELTR